MKSKKGNEVEEQDEEIGNWRQFFLFSTEKQFKEENDLAQEKVGNEDKNVWVTETKFFWPLRRGFAVRSHTSHWATCLDARAVWLTRGFDWPAQLVEQLHSACQQT